MVVVQLVASNQEDNNSQQAEVLHSRTEAKVPAGVDVADLDRVAVIGPAELRY